MNSPYLLSLASTQLWQLTLLVIIAAAAARVFCRDRPHLAMVLWLLVLAKCITPPLFAAPFGLFCRVAEPDPVPNHAAATESGPIAYFEKPKSEPVQPEAEIHYSYPSDPVSDESLADRLSTTDWLAIGWVTGTTIVILISLFRVLLCLRRIKHTTVPAPAELEDRLQQLRTTLGIRRNVSLVITSSAVGPAIVGLFRLRIIVPEMIARDGADRLEPILAHELIHVRRGDLWIGLLNLCSRGLWWFHPLIWWVSRQINRETERACDEEVLASLNCRPGDYARSLLRVLEQKNSLKAMPAFPGVRPVEITSQRMERIMNLRQGCRRGTSWRRRLCFVLAAALTLPGAVVSQDASESQPTKPARAKRQVLIKATIIDAPLGQAAKLLPSPPPRDTTSISHAGQASEQVTPGFGFSAVTAKAVRVLPHPVREERIPALPVAQNTGANVRLLSGKDAIEFVDGLKKLDGVETLATPTLLCNEGQTASLRSVGTRDIVIEVKPRVTPDGIDLKCQLLMEHADDVKNKVGQKIELRTKLADGAVLVQSGPGKANRETLLILKADAVQPIPEADLRTAVFSDHGIVGTVSSPEKLAAALPGKLTPSTSSSVVHIRALIAEANNKPLIFPHPIPSSQITIPVTQGDQDPISQEVRVYRMPREVGASLTKQFSKSADIHVLSRPQLTTLFGQQARIEIGQELQSLAADSNFRGLRLSLLPSEIEQGVNVSGRLFVHSGDDEPVTYELQNLNLGTGETTLLRLTRSGSQQSLLLSLSADVVRRNPPRMIQIEVTGEVRRPGVFEVPHGSSLLDAIAQAGGFSPKAGTRLHIEANGVGSRSNRIRLMSHTKPNRVLRVDSVLTATSLPRLNANDRVVVHRDDTRQLSGNKNVETRAHSIRELTSSSSTDLMLAQRLSRVFHPELWRQKGNSLRIDVRRPQQLVVTASGSVQEELDELLQQLGSSSMQTRTYPAADLVVPGGLHTSGSRDPVPQLDEAVAELEARIRALAPGEWENAGGASMMRFNRPTLSLVIRARAETHRRITELIEQLRRQQPGQVILETLLFSWPQGEPPQATLVGVRKVPDTGMSMVAKEIQVAGKHITAPKLTLFAGQQAEVKVGKIALRFRAKVEKQNIIVSAVLGKQTSAWVIPNGHTAVADVTTGMHSLLGSEAQGKRYGIRLKASRIEEVEEAELELGEVLGTSPTKAPPMITVTPNIIIQEEEEAQTLPSAWYLEDDVQYFPAGPEFKLRRQEQKSRQD